MRLEILRLHDRLLATTIYVTHDQMEAMTMASRIVVMKEGHIQQVGTPQEIYEEPVTMFVAGFMGSPGMNFLIGIYDHGTMTISDQAVIIPEIYHSYLLSYQGKTICLAIRPEDVHEQTISDELAVSVHIEYCEKLGYETLIHARMDQQKVIARIRSQTVMQENEQRTVYMDSKKIHFFDVETEGKII